jgi:hypothetical protein
MKARKRKRQRDALSPALKQLKRMRIEFERDASYLLSSVLGFVVTVKIKRSPPPPPKSPAMGPFEGDRARLQEARRNVAAMLHKPL